MHTEVMDQQSQRSAHVVLFSICKLLFIHAIAIQPVLEGHVKPCLQALPKDDQAAINVLLKEMDGLALGIQQMASLIKYKYKSLANKIAKSAEQNKKDLDRCHRERFSNREAHVLVSTSEADRLTICVNEGRHVVHNIHP
jgi:hypothetical protein